MTTRSSFTPLANLDSAAVQNIFLYICDALRWHHRPDRLADRGIALCSAAHGLYTPPAITSLLTGFYPQRHGATRFETPLAPDQDTIFDIGNTNSSFRHNQWDAHPVFNLLRQTNGPYINDIEPPFVYVEHDHGAHAPYPNLDTNVQEVFSQLSRDPDAHRSHYRNGVEASVDRFERRISILEERGLLDRTLVIFTSDHGELLGEHGGFVGHSLPATPELVYVPMILIHPSLSPATHASTLIEQVDLLPTIREILGFISSKGTRYDGQSLLEPVPLDRRAYNHGISYFPGNNRLGTLLDPIYHARSVWTREGGHVFVQSNFVKRLLVGFYDARMSAETGAYNRNVSDFTALRRILPMYIQATHTFGTPSITKTKAREYCTEVTNESSVSSLNELADETRQQLEDLGYR